MRIADFGLIDVLAAGAARAHRVDPQIVLVDVDVHLFHFRQHGDGRGRCVNATRRFGFRHALHAVHARFKFEFGVGAAAADFGDNLLEAAFGPLAHRQHFRLPALFGREALVHAEEIAGEQRGFVAAGAGTNFDDNVALIHRVLRQQREADVLPKFFQPLYDLRLFGFRHAPHFRIGRAVLDHGVEVAELRFSRAIRFDRIDHGPKLRVFAREAHECLRRDLSRKLALKDRLSMQQRIQFLLGQLHY